ncbi:MAG TPA: hypothetical protein VGH84_05875 [Steroidobacteraceae bacterium]|jgi:hypothetical protein
MSQADDNDRKLAHLVDRAVRGLPTRIAPPTLELRVLGELGRHVALPWWRQSFSHWPRYARTLFFAVCAALSGMAFVGGAWIVAGIGTVQAWRQTSAVVAGASALLISMVRTIPTAWLYDAAAVTAVLYALLFALGAAAYRTLWADL